MFRCLVFLTFVGSVAFPGTSRAAKPYDPPWWGFYYGGEGIALATGYPKKLLKRMPVAKVADPDILDTTRSVAAVNQALVPPGDRRLPKVLQSIKLVPALTERGPETLEIEGFVRVRSRNRTVLLIRFKPPGDVHPKAMRGEFFVPPRLRPGKAANLRVSPSKRPTRAQMKVLRQSLGAWLAKSGRTFEEFPEELGDRKVALVPVNIGAKQPRFLASMRFDGVSVGVVLVNQAGRVLRPLTPWLGPSRKRSADHEGFGIAALVDADGDGRDEVLVRQHGTKVVRRGLWRIGKTGLERVHVFYENKPAPETD